MISTQPSKVDVVGVGVSTTSYQEVSALCGNWISQRHTEAPAPGRYICVTSVHGVIESRKDSVLRAILNEADVVTPDGMPLVWALRSFGAKDQQRVYGPNLMLELCARAESAGHRVFLYGGRPETLDVLCTNLNQRFPNLVIAGRYSPPFRPLTEAEDEEVCAMVERARPDLLFVGISTPKQELWMAKHKRRFAGVVMIGVGAAFDFHAGRVRQAPAWMQSRGLEWLFRLCQEPGRLWKRYILLTPQFLPLWALQKLSLMIRNAGHGSGHRKSGVQDSRYQPLETLSNVRE